MNLKKIMLSFNQHVIHHSQTCMISVFHGTQKMMCSLKYFNAVLFHITKADSDNPIRILI